MIRVAAVGDIMLGDSHIAVGFGVRSRYRGASLAKAFEELAPRLKAADLAIGNLECPLSAVGVGGTRLERDQMRGDVEYARVLREVGFTAVAVANNHALQHGEAAFEQTVAALRNAGLVVLGLRGDGPWHGRPETFRGPGGESVAVLAYSWRPRQYGVGVPPYADVREGAVLGDVARARASHDAVIVSLHWGVEFVDQPSDAETRFAYALVENGADLVLGHHPHVTRPVEQRGSSVIAYSLGNCVCDMLWQPALTRGLLLEAELSPRPTKVTLTPTRIDRAYRVHVDAPMPVEAGGALAPLNPADYERQTAAGLGAQRAAAYRYMAANVFRYPPSVLATLIGVTVANKVGSLIARVTGARS
jgi:hypothetical protein